MSNRTNYYFVNEVLKREDDQIERGTRKPLQSEEDRISSYTRYMFHMVEAIDEKLDKKNKELKMLKESNADVEKIKRDNIFNIHNNNLSSNENSRMVVQHNLDQVLDNVLSIHENDKKIKNIEATIEQLLELRKCYSQEISVDEDSNSVDHQRV